MTAIGNHTCFWLIQETVAFIALLGAIQAVETTHGVHSKDFVRQERASAHVRMALFWLYVVLRHVSVAASGTFAILLPGFLYLGRRNAQHVKLLDTYWRVL
jgi:hypothetical protein